MTFVVKCMPVLKDWNYCCCSCSLRIASLVLAWFTTVGNFSQLIMCIIFLSYDNMKSYQTKEMAVSMIGSLIGGLVLECLHLYGIHNKKPMYMMPYLALCFIGLIIMGIVVLILSVYICMLNWIIGFICLIVGIGLLALSTFFWVVHYSYYRQLEEEKNSNTSIVNYTYGIPPDHAQITACPEDEKSLYPYNNKETAEMA